MAKFKTWVASPFDAGYLSRLPNMLGREADQVLQAAAALGSALVPALRTADAVIFIGSDEQKFGAEQQIPDKARRD